MANVHLINDTTYFTRIALHPNHTDTTPDLTWASPGLVKTWAPYSTTWGSDYLPVLVTPRGKRIRDRQTTRFHLNWATLREKLLQYDPPSSLKEMTGIIRNSYFASAETITCDETSPPFDNHLANLWKRMEYLTQLYRTSGRRHSLLRRMRDQCRTITAY